MKSNPGGQIDLKSVVGRDRLLASLWDAVAQQSLIMTSERRIGKTTLIKKMQHEPRPGWVPVFQDLEQYHTAADFALAVYREVHQFLSTKGRACRRAMELLRGLGGAEIRGFIKLPPTATPPWKEILTSAIEDLIHENDAAGTRLLFLWDELPYMLASIRDREGEPTAMAVLDLLRALRQTHPGLRMVLTGSIGLHHVLLSLKKKHYGNSPVNDMLAIDVPPLAEADAIQLARLLLEGEGLTSPHEPATTTAIAREADGFPFYIHHIVRALRVGDLKATPEQVAAVVASHLVDANDPWQLLHYRERIPIYYRGDEKAVVALLDTLAAGSQPATAGELLAALKAALPFDDRDRLLELLAAMERDHYLAREADGRYRFRFSLIRRWWKLHRGL